MVRVRRRAESGRLGPSSRRSIVLAILSVSVAVVLGGCGGDDDGGAAVPGPLVDQVVPAIEAVVAARGGPLQLFEVNADARLVNVFVATDGGTTAVAYVYLDGELQAPAPPRDGASGFTFSSEDVRFDADRVLSGVREDLPGSTITRFVVLGAPGPAVRFEAIVASRQGGVLAVGVGPDGAVLGVEPL